ncbi:type I restriction endonuclease subunit R [Streptomyces sp. NPDC050504]|uniref:type I restriction endonuclease subunit R n=1 Tax=Streptomyces sp. NPDC050504 TaxID=3365618 RepID=UPI0037B76EDE
MARSEVERDEVEGPFIQQLESMGWTHVRGKDLADEGRAYTDVLLKRRLRAAVRRVNRIAETDAEWVEEVQAAQAIADLAGTDIGPQGRNLKEGNFAATELLLHGSKKMRGPAALKAQDVFVQYIDWDIEDEAKATSRNEFLVVSQLRVRTAAGFEEIPDLVLFVNGIPVGVVECKSPDLQNPVRAAVRDLRAYAGLQPEHDEEERDTRTAPRGIPELFRTVQLLIAASGKTAYLGTITSRERDYAPWRSVEPDYEKVGDLRNALRQVGCEPRLLEAGEEPSEQQMLVAAVLKPVNLLNILRHYVFPMPLKQKKAKKKRDGGGTGASGGAPKIKVVCRHQQYRAVEKMVARLRERRTPLDPGATHDERGGVIWHTQGSGKSLTMAFLARRLHMSRDVELNSFTLLVVTDRTQLQRQLDAAIRTGGGRSVKTAQKRNEIEGMLRDGGRHVIFSMIQKFGFPGSIGQDGGDDREFGEEYRKARKKQAAEAAQGSSEKAGQVVVPPYYPLCTDSTKVLVLVDEAHRSHTSMLHACLRQAAPNAARIGFTGTPIMEGKLRDTERIFGPFIDTYKMAEAELDKVVVPIRYEGRTGPADVRKGEALDVKFENLIADRTEEQRKALRKKYSQPTERDVAESLPMIRAKAKDMLEHYVTRVLPDGFKAQVAAVSRPAVVAYRDALNEARAELLERVAVFAPDGRFPERFRGVPLKEFSPEDRVLYWAWRNQAVIRRMEFVPVISAGKKKDGGWSQWTDESRQQAHIERFLEDLPELPRDNPWALTHVAQPAPARPAAGAGLPWSKAVPDPPVRPGIPEDAPVAFLIVKSMLLTGFDAPIEQVLYLDRPIRDAELLQAVARVNRPAPGKEGGLVVDYYGVLAPLSDALSGYGREATAVRASLPGIEKAIVDAQTAATKVREFLSGMDITDLDSRGGRARAMLALNDENDRALFDKRLKDFLGFLELVLPHEKSLAFLEDATRWALLQQRVRQHYRDTPGGGFPLRDYGRKVRALIAEHLEAPEITQVIPPVSILSSAFDSDVRDIEDPREAAAEMEHALRFHLEEHTRREDETKYRALSKALKDVLENMDARWRVDELAKLIDQARKEEEDDPLLAGAGPLERRVHSWLKGGIDAAPSIVEPEPAELRRLSAGVYEVVRKTVRPVSYQGKSKHVTLLTAHLTERLRGDGLSATTGDTQVEVKVVARHIVNHVQEHLQAFKSER